MSGGGSNGDLDVAKRASAHVLEAARMVDPLANISCVQRSTSVSGCPDGLLVKIVPSVGGETSTRILTHLRTAWPLVDVASTENHLDGGVMITVHLPTKTQMRYTAAQEARDGALVWCLSMLAISLVAAAAIVLFLATFGSGAHHSTGGGGGAAAVASR
jgi:hypothetical protein